jgi:hypothetical protein
MLLTRSHRIYKYTENKCPKRACKQQSLWKSIWAEWRGLFMYSFPLEQTLFFQIISKNQEEMKTLHLFLLSASWCPTMSLVFSYCFFVGIFTQFSTMKILFTDFLRKQTKAWKWFQNVIYHNSHYTAPFDLHNQVSQARPSVRITELKILDITSLQNIAWILNTSHTLLSL